MFDLAATLNNPINLSIGIPDFDAPPQVKNAAKRAIDAGKNKYTVTQGIEELRDVVRERYGIAPKDTEMDVFITSGVSGGLFLSYAILLDPGDEILIPEPYFGMYRDLARLLNAKPVYYDTYPSFSLPVEQISGLITAKTRAILLNSPSNPTGYAFSQKELDDLVEVARKKHIWIIYDEIYDCFSYDAPHAQCFGKYENILVLNGFSKSAGVPGWRTGYAVGPKAAIQEMAKIQQYSFVCAPSIAQWGLLETWNSDFGPLLETYRKKRDFICEALKDKYNFVQPGGAFYLFPEAPGGNSAKFVERCVKENLLVVPGNVFSQRDTHFRISFSASFEQLERGVEVLNRLA